MSSSGGRTWPSRLVRRSRPAPALPWNSHPRGSARPCWKSRPVAAITSWGALASGVTQASCCIGGVGRPGTPPTSAAPSEQTAPTPAGPAIPGGSLARDLHVSGTCTSYYTTISALFCRCARPIARYNRALTVSARHRKGKNDAHPPPVESAWPSAVLSLSRGLVLAAPCRAAGRPRGARGAADVPGHRRPGTARPTPAPGPAMPCTGTPAPWTSPS